MRHSPPSPRALAPLPTIATSREQVVGRECRAPRQEEHRSDDPCPAYHDISHSAREQHAAPLASATACRLRRKSAGGARGRSVASLQRKTAGSRLVLDWPVEACAAQSSMVVSGLEVRRSRWQTHNLTSAAIVLACGANQRAPDTLPPSSTIRSTERPLRSPYRVLNNPDHFNVQGGQMILNTSAFLRPSS